MVRWVNTLSWYLTFIAPQGRVGQYFNIIATAILGHVILQSFLHFNVACAIIYCGIVPCKYNAIVLSVQMKFVPTTTIETHRFVPIENFAYVPVAMYCGTHD